MSDQKKTATKKLCSRIVFMIGLPGIFLVHAGNLPDTQELMQVLGTDQKELVNLDQGKIISFDVTKGDKKELAASLVIY